MSHKAYVDGCPGCRPAMYELRTGRVMPDDDPIMVRLLAVWEASGRATKVAFHNVTCNNSRDPMDLMLTKVLMQDFKKLMNTDLH